MASDKKDRVARKAGFGTAGNGAASRSHGFGRRDLAAGSELEMHEEAVRQRLERGRMGAGEGRIACPVEGEPLEVDRRCSVGGEREGGVTVTEHARGADAAGTGDA